MKKICLFLLLSQMVISCFSQNKMLTKEEIIIPLDHSTMRPIVELTIDGKGPYRFIFDTGAGTNVIDQGLMEEFGFKVVGQDSLKSQGPTRLVSQRVAVTSVGFKGTPISKDAEMNVISLRQMLPVDGVLSPTFFEEYLITLDYPASKLILTKGSLDKNETGVATYLQSSTAINLEISVDGKMVKAHLDSGSPGSLGLPYSMKDQLKFESEPVYDSEIRTPVATYKKWRAKLIGEIKVGSVVYKDQMVSLVQGFDYANIGYGLIQNLRITIDRKNNLILFEKGDPIASDDDSSYEPGDGYAGWYDGRVRKVFEKESALFLQRGRFTVKLEPLEGDLFKMTYHIPVNNELPNVRFEREEGRVIGLTFIYQDGREVYAKKDLE